MLAVQTSQCSQRPHKRACVQAHECMCYLWPTAVRPQPCTGALTHTLIMVDLPAPLGPMTATREFSEQKMDTSSSVFLGAVGYLRRAAHVWD